MEIHPLRHSATNPIEVIRNIFKLASLLQRRRENHLPPRTETVSGQRYTTLESPGGVEAAAGIAHVAGSPRARVRVGIRGIGASGFDRVVRGSTGVGTAFKPEPGPVGVARHGHIARVLGG